MALADSPQCKELYILVIWESCNCPPRKLDTQTELQVPGITQETVLQRKEKLDSSTIDGKTGKIRGILEVFLKRKNVLQLRNSTLFLYSCLE